MDHNVNAAERMIAEPEASNETACRECARVNGHTAAEADQCDDGNVGCKGRPFRVAAGLR